MRLGRAQIYGAPGGWYAIYPNGNSGGNAVGGETDAVKSILDILSLRW